MPMHGFFNSIMLGLAVCIGLNTTATADFELRDGDRVVFLGNSFFERALSSGFIESSLALRWPDRKITFRNLGWDGDTVFGHSRAGGRRRAVFGDAEEGFQRMVKHVKSLRPSVIFVAYGFNESFADNEGIKSFRNGLNRLLDEVDSPTTRIVLLSPVPIAAGYGTDIPFPTGDDGQSYVTKRNDILADYSKVIKEAARNRNSQFVDLFASLRATYPSMENGIHLSADGYRDVAEMIAEGLDLPPPQIDVQSELGQSIRNAIIRKNTLYFHRWRPRNDAFVYGERKDEQKIAQTEPEKFEPFIARQEKLIRKLLGSITATPPSPKQRIDDVD